jgi:hypothetical protein
MDSLRHIYVSKQTNVWNTQTNVCNKRVELHDRVTKNRELLHIPLCKTLSGQRNFRFRAVRLWNILDNELKQLPLPINEQAVQPRYIAQEFLLSKLYL